MQLIRFEWEHINYQCTQFPGGVQLYTIPWGIQLYTLYNYYDLYNGVSMALRFSQ